VTNFVYIFIIVYIVLRLPFNLGFLCRQYDSIGNVDFGLQGKLSFIKVI
jgi:hypothetical protein